MKKTALAILTLMTILASLLSCNNGETYAEKKDKEKNAIQAFIKDNDFVGPITVISESAFKAQDSLTNIARNEFVLFEDDGIYMQIIKKGEGQSMKEMAMEQPDSSISKNILCRYMEYDIESGDTTSTNLLFASIVDKMLVKYSQYSQSYTASFTEGKMAERYKSASVPSGWLKPLGYIRLTRDAGKIAKVRMIVPHSSGTSNASGYVLPYYYEISYQLGR